MDWKQLQALIYNALVIPDIVYYTDSHITAAADANYLPYVGERLPFAPYFSWSWNMRYEQPFSSNLRGYAQFDVAHKGDMWNELTPKDKNINLPRILQPDYTIAEIFNRKV